MLTNVKGKSFRETVYANSSPVVSGVSMGPKKKPEYSRERLDEDITICLSCTREKCTGNCNKIQESRRVISRERKHKRDI